MYSKYSLALKVIWVDPLSLLLSCFLSLSLSLPPSVSLLSLSLSVSLCLSLFLCLSVCLSLSLFPPSLTSQLYWRKFWSTTPAKGIPSQGSRATFGARSEWVCVKPVGMVMSAGTRTCFMPWQSLVLDHAGNLTCTHCNRVSYKKFQLLQHHIFYFRALSSKKFYYCVRNWKQKSLQSLTVSDQQEVC